MTRTSLPARRLRAAPLITAAILGGAAPAALAAASAGGVTFPPSVDEAGRTLVENGAGLRVFFLVVDGYASALYLPRPAHDLSDVLAEPGPKEIRTVFLHAASAEQLRHELARIHDTYCAHAACPASDERAYATLLSHQAPVRAGEGEQMLLTAGGVTVSRDGAPPFTIADPHFGDALLASMLGPSAPTARYRRGLLGLAT